MWQCKHSAVAAIAALLQLVLIAAGHAQGQPVPAPAPAPGFTPAPPFFWGQLVTAGQPADPGTVVTVMIVRGPTDYTICGKGSVGQPRPGAIGTAPPGAGAYSAPIDTTNPSCVDAHATYTFYVNQVFAGSIPNPDFTANGGSRQFDLSVGPLALALSRPGNPTGSGIPLIYFYGTVMVGSNPAPPGVQVTAMSADKQCIGQGTTSDLDWKPQTASGKEVTQRGFYWVAVGPAAGAAPAAGASATCSSNYLFYVNGVLVGQRPANVGNGEFGTGQQNDLSVAGQ